MLNFLQTILHGSSKSQPEEDQLKYETREDNDWLLVDVADEKTPELDKEDPEPKSEEKDDDEVSPGQLEELSDSVLNISAHSSEEDVSACRAFNALFGPRSEIGSVRYYELKSRSCLPYKFIRYYGAMPLVTLDKRYATEEEIKRWELMESYTFSNSNSFVKVEHEDAQLDMPGDETENMPPVMSPERKKRTAHKNAMPYTVKSKTERVDKRSHNPAALSGAFVNHQSPIHYSKTELLLQIKALKPAQLAKEHEGKKFMKKPQLNRQNKAYHYEASNKNQHRRDLWQRHSGANNNRKCC